jgi:PhoH-like ATPase
LDGRAVTGKTVLGIAAGLEQVVEQRSSRDADGLISSLTQRGQLSLESVTFLRGRSLQRQFVVVDEAQNLEPTTLKTILTRVGEGTKVVFTGDTSQIDAPYLDDSNNALAADLR